MNVMTDNPANKVMATIESARVGRRQEEGARFFALVSMPVGGNEQMVLNLIKGIHNPIEMTFTLLQPELAPILAAASASSNGTHADEPDAELTTMVVDGEPASVKRPRQNRARDNGHTPESIEDLAIPEAYAGMTRAEADAAWEHGEQEKHEFIQHKADTRCWLCGFPPEESFHVAVVSTGNALADELIAAASEGQ